MTGRTAIFVARDGSNNGTTPVGARLALGGLLAGNGGSPLDVRAGVLVDAGGALVSGTAGMSYDVRPFRAVSLVSAANGPTLGGNDATVNVATTAAPGSNARIDLIWARQHHVSGDGGSDSDVTYEIGVTQGTVAASPTAPATPSGAVALYHATVTAGVVATSGLTFTRAHAWTVANGGVIPVLTSGERSAITAYEGMSIWYSPEKQLQVWDGTAWVGVGRGQANPVFVGYLTTAVSVSNLTTVVITTWVQHPTHSRPGSGHFSMAAGVLTCVKSGLYQVRGRLEYVSGGTGYRKIGLRVNGVEVSDATAAAGSTNITAAIIQILYLNAGDTLSFTARQNGGTTINALGDPATLNSSFSVEYVGTPA